jgi:hypothetical protein
LGLALLGGCWLGEPPEQGRHSGDVLAGPSKLRKTVAVLYNSSVNVTGPGPRASALRTALHDFTLKLSALFLQPTACFLELMLSCLQLLDGQSSQLWWG